MQKIENNLLFNEIQQTQRLKERVATFQDTFSDFVSDMMALPVKERKDYFIDENDLKKLAEAKEVIDTIYQSSYCYGIMQANKFLKAQKVKP